MKCLRGIIVYSDCPVERITLRHIFVGAKHPNHTLSKNIKSKSFFIKNF